MKINMHKLAGGTFVPFDDIEQERTTKLKTGEVYAVEVKRVRNPQFHRKVFAFFNFCFQYWADDKSFKDEAGQRDVFRKNLTATAGYYDEYYNLKGEVRVEAKSLSFGSMDQEEFEQCYSALINAALRIIFKDCNDPYIENQLVGFFS